MRIFMKHTLCCSTLNEDRAKFPEVIYVTLAELRVQCDTVLIIDVEQNRRLLRSRGHTMTPQACVHISAITEVKHPEKRVCEECVKIGSTWVHLRTCQECGATLCCDSSPNRHATKHAHATGHPVIASAEPGERWLYCYPDDAFAEY